MTTTNRKVERKGLEMALDCQQLSCTGYADWNICSLSLTPLLLTFSAVVVHIWAALDSGAISKLWSKAITSAAMLFATCPLMNGLTGSVLYRRKYSLAQYSHNNRYLSPTQPRRLQELLWLQTKTKTIMLLSRGHHDCLPCEFRIPLPANRGLSSFLFVTSWQATSGFWTDSFNGGPDTDN